MQLQCKQCVSGFNLICLLDDCPWRIKIIEKKRIVTQNIQDNNKNLYYKYYIYDYNAPYFNDKTM